MNQFGSLFKISIFGESHGAGLGVVIDGCPPGIAIDLDDFTEDLQRRKSGAKGTTPRIEKDEPQIVSGVFNGVSTGAPICIMFKNTNTRHKDYRKIKDIPRPGHADFVASVKYRGYNDYRGGGHFSGRLTLPLVAAGVIAKKIIPTIKPEARLIEAGGDTNISKALDLAIQKGESIGGVVECRASGIPVGLGEPFFDSVESLISHIVFAIPAIKGIEFGSGFQSASMYGSEHNDVLIDETGKTASNHAGGINGGITNGNELVFRVAVKPTSSIPKAQQTMNLKQKQLDELKVEGRHDSCIALRVPPVLEAVTAIVLADLLLISRAQG